MDTCFHQRIIIFRIKLTELNLDRDRDRGAYLGAGLITLLSQMRRFLLNRWRLQPCSQVLSQVRVGEDPGKRGCGAYTSKYDIVLRLGDIARVYNLSIYAFC